MSIDTTIDACWSRIGVRGDRSCVELEVHIHCRNCPVYSAAARALLDTPLAVEVLESSTRHLAQQTEPVSHTSGASSSSSSSSSSSIGAVSSGEVCSVIVFRLRAEWFALPTALCLEVADLRPIHSLPHRRNGAVLGVANVRGELLVCLSLADILGASAQVESVQPRSGAGAPRLLVVRSESGAVVFPVDEIHGVLRVQTRDLKEIPATVAKAQLRYTKALLPLGKNTVGLIDDPLLFHTVERSLA